jgi:hypothetical protein
MNPMMQHKAPMRFPTRILTRTLRARLTVLALCVQAWVAGSAQKNSSFEHSATAVQYGYALKASLEIGRKKNSTNWRLGVSLGTGAYLGANWLYPSLHTDFMLYHGGIGSARPGNKKAPGVSVECLIAYTFTAGFENRMREGHRLQPGKRNYPLYYFNNFTAAPLQNPMNYSLSYGGNVIFTPTRTTNKWQQVGFFNLHLDRMQLSYANDGPPFYPPFGDRYDRFHTGAGYLSLHGDDDWPVNLIEIGFNKFTGYSKNAYELSNKVGTNYIYYRDEEQQYYNKSRFYFTVANTAKQYGASFNLYNHPDWDVQHRIHLNMFYPFHMVPYHPANTVGGLFYYGQSKIGLQ